MPKANAKVNEKVLSSNISSVIQTTLGPSIRVMGLKTKHDPSVRIHDLTTKE